MAHAQQQPLHASPDATGQPTARVVHTADRRPRVQYEGLFLEPDWPPPEDDSEV
ncbi:hypothetical protein AB0N17_02860 [Streptomyces sp. NPDC051133]|uniref:hypothetical protein n=1 Tax=Streptomyces sp. NPDC051133 TaxID=3155521 RepID=UPI00343D8FC6